MSEEEYEPTYVPSNCKQCDYVVQYREAIAVAEDFSIEFGVEAKAYLSYVNHVFYLNVINGYYDKQFPDTYKGFRVVVVTSI